MSAKKSLASSESRLSSLLGPPIEIDHNAPGTITRIAMALEAVFNTALSSQFLFYPAASIRGLLSQQTALASTSAPPAAVSFIQWSGALTMGFTGPMLLGCTNTRSGIEARKSVYIAFSILEGLTMPLYLWQANVLGEEGSGLVPSKLNGLTAVILPFFLWRCWVLFVKPEWFGRYREVKKEQ